jgi:hypothetical protein
MQATAAVAQTLILAMPKEMLRAAAAARRIPRTRTARRFDTLGRHKDEESENDMVKERGDGCSHRHLYGITQLTISGLIFLDNAVFQNFSSRKS